MVGINCPKIILRWHNTMTNTTMTKPAKKSRFVKFTIINDTVYIKIDEATVREMNRSGEFKLNSWIPLMYAYKLAKPQLRRKLDYVVNLYVQGKIKPFPIDGEIVTDIDWINFGFSRKNERLA
jgi:hypothetical protein